MSEARSTSRNDGDGSGYETLTRVLAREGRSTLARVELAASELARFEVGPAIFDRLETIREAAREVDALLGKIDLLAGPRAREVWPVVEVERIWRGVLTRLAPTFSARGIEVGLCALGRCARVALPEATLEAIFCAYVRLLLPLATREGRLDVVLMCESGAVRVSCAPELACGGDDVLGLSGRAESVDDHARLEDTASVEIDREAQVEFEVLLAEWGGALHERGAESLRRTRRFSARGQSR